LRDWMNTAELAATGARITAALTEALPDPSGKPVVFAACGAAGLLAEIPPAFDCLMGFDLTLPVLAAARRLLDGNSVELALPRAIRETGRATLRGRPDRPARAPVTLVAMDALNTALADGSVACVVTSFLLDLIPEPRQLANEIHRILCNDGVWINYGPSGPLTAFWRFDAAEGAAFIEAAGFTVMKTEAHRATYLDVSDDCPMWSFRSHICYLTSARKAQQGSPRAHARTPGLAEVSALVPQHFAGAQLVQRHSLGPDGARTAVFRHDGIPGRARSLELDRDTVRIMALVDGMRTVDDIAALLGHDAPAPPREAILSAFARYFAEGLLDWRSR